jgi:hypothetical protein
MIIETGLEAKYFKSSLENGFINSSYDGSNAKKTPSRFRLPFLFFDITQNHSLLAFFSYQEVPMSYVPPLKIDNTFPRSWNVSTSNPLTPKPSSKLK